MLFTDILVIAVQLIWGICEYIIRKKMIATEENADSKSYKVLYNITIISVLLGITAGWIIRFTGIFGFYSSSTLFPVLGSAIILLGLYIRLTAIVTLKKYFTVNVTIMEDHKLITDGLYKIIRHPAYAGGILSFIGCGLCYGNFVSFIIISVPYILLILDRIKHEEIVLVGKFGQAYIDLQHKTWKLIPYIY